jgi:hypothetical protein
MQMRASLRSSLGAKKGIRNAVFSLLAPSSSRSETLPPEGALSPVLVPRSARADLHESRCTAMWPGPAHDDAKLSASAGSGIITRSLDSGLEAHVAAQRDWTVPADTSDDLRSRGGGSSSSTLKLSEVNHVAPVSSATITCDDKPCGQGSEGIMNIDVNHITDGTAGIELAGTTPTGREDAIDQMCWLGFSREDCETALTENDGSVEQAMMDLVSKAGNL